MQKKYSDYSEKGFKETVEKRFIVRNNLSALKGSSLLYRKKDFYSIQAS